MRVEMWFACTTAQRCKIEAEEKILRASFVEDKSHVPFRTSKKDAEMQLYETRRCEAKVATKKHTVEFLRVTLSMVELYDSFMSGDLVNSHLRRCNSLRWYDDFGLANRRMEWTTEVREPIGVGCWMEHQGRRSGLYC